MKGETSERVVCQSLRLKHRSTEVNGTNYTTRAVTNLLVSQVVAGNETSRSSRKLSIPVQLVFVTEEVIS